VAEWLVFDNYCHPKYRLTDNGKTGLVITRLAGWLRRAFNSGQIGTPQQQPQQAIAEKTPATRECNNETICQ
jgi:hypothetical protein